MRTEALPRSPSEVAYLAQQLSMAVPAAVSQRFLRLALGRGVRPEPRDIAALERRLFGLYARDLENVRSGLYPRSLLFQLPAREYARRVPQMLRDFPRVMRRSGKKDWRDLPDAGEAKQYPPYFRRTFHWQSDGYLSRASAERYDVGVEFLFGGTADVMRRQVIPPITRHLREREPAAGPARLLDVACGTGRTLAQIHVAHPALRLTGLDLSPYYVQHARTVLDAVPDASFVAENAEAMPFKDDWFDVVTSVYLFHELPRNARRNVLREMLRVLRPGGLCVIEDSAQRVESPEMMFFLERFPEDFHEPFYTDYLGDDLAEAAREVGFEVAGAEAVFVAKVVTLRKPE